MIKNLYNKFNYDISKCNNCKECVKICPSKCISICDNDIFIENKKCISCRKCISICKQNALYYYIRTNCGFSKDNYSVVPEKNKNNLLVDSSKKIFTTLLAEKIILLEKAYFLNRILEYKLQEYNIDKKIIIDNIQQTYDLNEYNERIIYEIDPYSLTKDLIFKLYKDDNIDYYGLPFTLKGIVDKKIIDNNYDLPCYYEAYYSVLDLLKLVTDISKTTCNVNLNFYIPKNGDHIVLKNKYTNLEILVITKIEDLNIFIQSNYDLILILENKAYIGGNFELLKDEELNNIYQKFYKYPLKKDNNFWR